LHRLIVRLLKEKENGGDQQLSAGDIGRPELDLTV
jgi:hypothetical protein